MAEPLQITYRFLITFLLFSLFSGQEKWNYSAEEMDQIKVNKQIIRRLKRNVRFVKTDQIILTDNAVQYIADDILHLNGNTIMINGLDTLTCDSMVYWSQKDSGYAMGNVHYVQPENDRRLTTEIFHYWQTEGYRGSSFITKGYTQIKEPDQLITANAIIYDDITEMMQLRNNASVENPTRGIFGDEMIVQYADSLIEQINITSNAYAYNDLNVKINADGLYRKFRDEMSSREMIAYFKDEEITQLELMNMATTYYHVINDSLLTGNNEASGDSIQIEFRDGNIIRIQVAGGALGEFNPEGDNTKIDTTIFYGADYLDYHIDDKKTFLSKDAFVEYQNTKLSAGAIVVDWQTNIMDAIKVDEEYPIVKTLGKEPMKGNSMVFDLVAKHGRIDQGRTSLNNSFYHGREVFRDDPNLFHVVKSKYTSCELDQPHFYMGSRKMKMLPGDKVIAKPLWLHIYDMPIIGIPLAVFPNKGGKRHSGWIMPSFESYHSIGTGLRNFGYYWAPNDYMDAKTVVNFFDKEGVQLNSSLKYKRRHGQSYYNYKLNGNLHTTFKRRITTSEIMDLTEESLIAEIFRLNWNHSQDFDPTQGMRIKYNYISDKDAYQNTQEVNLQNRLTQNLKSSFNYYKNWQTSAFSVGYDIFRDLAIENKEPVSSYLNEGRYKSYKYEDGPKFSFSMGNRKIFGKGDSWYNSLTSSYSMNASTGRRDHYLIRETDSTWADADTIKLKHGGIKHSAHISAPQKFFNWLTITPTVSIWEDWVFHYKEKQPDLDTMITIEKDEFKRRLTWNSSIIAMTKLYGLFPVSIGNLSAIRHVMTPTLSFTYMPDFSDPKFGGDNYFQILDSGETFDYFNGSYVGGTPSEESQFYRFNLRNTFQAKIHDEEEKYDKVNFLTWNSRISYHPLRKNSKKLDPLESNVSIKNLSGHKLIGISMLHSFYRLSDGELIDIWEGELPRLTYINLATDLQFNLFGSENGAMDKSDVTDIQEELKEEFYNEENQTTLNKENSSNLWETQLNFSYSTNWIHPDKNWNYTFFLNSTHKIKLSRNWSLSYTANFNLKEKEITRNKFSIYRPLHCWEFNFNYWPQGNFSGFSLEIKVKNPDLQDIKVISSDSKRSFSGY